MKRCLVLISSLLLTFATVSTASSASPWAWASAAGTASAGLGIQARLGSGWSPLAPSSLIAAGAIHL